MFYISNHKCICINCKLRITIKKLNFIFLSYRITPSLFITDIPCSTSFSCPFAVSFSLSMKYEVKNQYKEGAVIYLKIYSIYVYKQLSLYNWSVWSHVLGSYNEHLNA
jgi:hypothetical protein